jgi:hypothetical protein
VVLVVKLLAAPPLVMVVLVVEAPVMQLAALV